MSVFANFDFLAITFLTISFEDGNLNLIPFVLQYGKISGIKPAELLQFQLIK